MNPEVKLDRQCRKCGFNVKQDVTFKEEDGRIKVVTYRAQCPICGGFLKVPTPGEVRRALLIKESQQG